MPKIIVYSATGCYYCDQVKELFQRAQLEVEYLTKDTHFTREEFIRKFPDAAGYPQVIIDGENIGGLVETATYLVQNKYIIPERKGFNG